MQEDINLGELEDEHWLCDAGADRHVRQVSGNRGPVPKRGRLHRGRGVKKGGRQPLSRQD